MKKTDTSFSIGAIITLFLIGTLCAAFMPLMLFIGPIGLFAWAVS